MLVSNPSVDTQPFVGILLLGDSQASFSASSTLSATSAPSSSTRCVVALLPRPATYTSQLVCSFLRAPFAFECNARVHVQSYWQSAIAAKPSATYKGYILGGAGRAAYARSCERAVAAVRLADIIMHLRASRLLHVRSHLAPPRRPVLVRDPLLTGDVARPCVARARPAHHSRRGRRWYARAHLGASLAGNSLTFCWMSPRSHRAAAALCPPIGTTPLLHLQDSCRRLWLFTLWGKAARGSSWCAQPLVTAFALHCLACTVDVLRPAALAPLLHSSVICVVQIMLFMAVTSTGSAEQIAVSSLVRTPATVTCDVFCADKQRCISAGQLYEACRTRGSFAALEKAGRHGEL